MAIVLAACRPSDEGQSLNGRERTRRQRTCRQRAHRESGSDPDADRGFEPPDRVGCPGIARRSEEASWMGPGGNERLVLEDGLVTIDFADDGTTHTVRLLADVRAIRNPAITTSSSACSPSGNAVAIWDAVNTANMGRCVPAPARSRFSAVRSTTHHVPTAPSDDIQGRLLGTLMLEDGVHQRGRGLPAVPPRTARVFCEVITAASPRGGLAVPSPWLQGFDPAQQIVDPRRPGIVSPPPRPVATITYAEGAFSCVSRSARALGSGMVRSTWPTVSVDNVTVEDVGGERGLLLRGDPVSLPAVAPSTGELNVSPTSLCRFAPEGKRRRYSRRTCTTAWRRWSWPRRRPVLVPPSASTRSSGSLVMVRSANRSPMPWTRSGRGRTSTTTCSGCLTSVRMVEPAWCLNVTQYNAEGTSENQDEISGEAAFLHLASAWRYDIQRGARRALLGPSPRVPPGDASA